MIYKAKEEKNVKGNVTIQILLKICNILKARMKITMSPLASLLNVVFFYFNNNYSKKDIDIYANKIASDLGKKIKTQLFHEGKNLSWLKYLLITGKIKKNTQSLKRKMSILR